MADDLYKAYDQKQVVNTPFATANFQSQGGNVNAVGRSPDSPSGTAWNQTFTQNNPYSPSGTNWSSTFARTNTGLPPSFTRSASASQFSPNPNYVGMASPSGSDWSRTFGRTAGNTTPPPSPGDIDNTFFGGATPSPTPTPRPQMTDLYRNRMRNSYSPLTPRDFEMYGAGAV